MEVNLDLQVLALCLIICTAVLHLVIQARRDNISAGASIRKGAGSAVVFVISALVFWPVTGLLGYHVRVSGVASCPPLCLHADASLSIEQLLLLNLTTIEQVRLGTFHLIWHDVLTLLIYRYGTQRTRVWSMVRHPQIPSLVAIGAGISPKCSAALGVPRGWTLRPWRQRINVNQTPVQRWRARRRRLIDRTFV